jgi:L-aminopeptidase/D-esterase-like protein
LLTFYRVSFYSRYRGGFQNLELSENRKPRSSAVNDAITDVPGIEVGHAQNLEAATGCTVVLCEQGAITGVDTRGGAPGTRETDCLRPENLVSQTHAVFLTGGSAYGLDCAGGIMRFLEEKEVGFDLGFARVPIVAGAVLQDLALGDPKVRPDAAMGYTACCNATAVNTEQGNVGAGTGANIGRMAGPLLGHTKGGLGTASQRVGDLVVGAIVAVNCNGDVVDPETGEIIAGTLRSDGKAFADALKLLSSEAGPYKPVFPSNTTIGVVATNAVLDKAMAKRVAMMAQDGYAVTIRPVHTLGDGDTVFCMATSDLAADVSQVGAIAAHVMVRAVVKAVKAAESLCGLPAYRDLVDRGIAK